MTYVCRESMGDEADEDEHLRLLHRKRRKLEDEVDEVIEHVDIDNIELAPFQSTKSCHEVLHLYFQRNSTEKVAVIFDNGKGKVEEMSYGALDRAANHVKTLIQTSLQDCEFIGVQCHLGRLYPALVIGIMRSARAFFNIEKEKWEDAVFDGVKFLNLRYILCDSAWTVGERHGRTFTVSKFLQYDILDGDLSIYVYEVIGNSKNLTECSLLPDIKFAYAIQTSGTTGKSKMVLVPHACICPNVEDFLRKSWNVSCEDVIFGAAPPTFDPHIVELFVALGAGATILYTPSSVKLQGPTLAKLLVHHRISILQITPSLFRRLSDSLKISDGLMESLKIVAFGGEQCPTKEELRVALGSLNNKENIKFQNIYGVTEVSSWASVCNIDLNTDDPITIGVGILETEVKLEYGESRESGEIVINSPTRFSYIIDSSTAPNSSSLISTKFRYFTGDVGKLTPHGIVYEGRKDRVVKRNGMKVSLRHIEQMALSTGLMSYAECKLDQGKIYLFVKLKEQYESINAATTSWNAGACLNTMLIPSLSSKLDLPVFMYPDIIISIKCIPLNINGKVDFSQVIRTLHDVRKETVSISGEQVINTLAPVWTSCTWPGIRPTEELLRENFLEVGGNSVSAARFVESAFLVLKLFGSETHQKYEHDVLGKLLAANFHDVAELIIQILTYSQPIKTKISSLELDLLPEIQDSLSHSPTHQSLESSYFEYDLFDTLMSTDDLSVFNEVDNLGKTGTKLISYSLNLVNMFDFTLGLCVDASPTVSTEGFAKERVFIGCHGGILLCIDLSVLRVNFNCTNKAIVWKCRLPNRVEAPVALSEDTLFAFVGCHDCNFYKINASNGAVVCFTTCSSSIRSKAAISEEYRRVIFIDSANCIHSVNSYDLNVNWKQDSFKLLATVRPIIYRNYCYVTTLDNGPIAIDILNGNLIWSCDKSCENLKYSSLSLEKVSFTETKHRKWVLLNGKLDDTEESVEARNPKTGGLMWSHDETTHFSSSQMPRIVFEPIYNQCCDNIVSISSSNFELKLLCSHSREYKRYAWSNCFDKPVASSLIHMYRKDNTRDCALFFKIRDKLSYSVLHLHSGKWQELHSWFMQTNFETFSKPVTCGEYILFGGRDNKLHVIKCESLSSL